VSVLYSLNVPSSPRLINDTAVLPVLPETCLPTGSDTNTGSSASFSRIKFWLDVCISSHPACSQADFQPPPLPKRVIAVGQKGSSRCCLVSGKEKNGHYATLSHCWGDPNHRPLTTTDQTLACRQQGIENEELPKTFQHAVEVCRQIGIDYLWIDSLCIIQEQESQEDWAKEAPRMGFVYGNSTLTISAAAAADSTQGCFQERFGLFFWPCPVVMFGRACYVSRYPTYKERYYGDPGELDRSIPLFQRAWVLQEQALSRRSIIFSKNQLVWRCPTLSTNEKFPLGTPHMPSIVTDNLRLIHCIINGITSLIPKSLRFGIYTCWYKIVEDFTSRSLTYNGDRLPAIAGIAKRLGMSANDSYHAGLWRRDLIHGLLWRVTIYVKHVTRSATAPSWSWASIDCAVDYQHFSGGPHKHQRSPSSPLVDILDILDPATCEDHPFGATSKASLRLSGVLLKVVEDGHEDFELALTENGTYFRSDLEDLYLDVGEPDRTAETVLVCLPVCVRHGETHDRVSDCETYKALWKRSLETGKDEFEGKNKIYCLVLQPVEGKQDTFSRLGLCTIGRDYDIRNKITEISRIAFGERRSITII
jgi:hypothetical protein